MVRLFQLMPDVIAVSVGELKEGLDCVQKSSPVIAENNSKYQCNRQLCYHPYRCFTWYTRRKEKNTLKQCFYRVLAGQTATQHNCKIKRKLSVVVNKGGGISLFHLWKQLLFASFLFNCFLRYWLFIDFAEHKELLTSLVKLLLGS